MKLFLDIDGVMVHANPHRKVEQDEDGFYRFNVSAIEALKYLLNHQNIDEIILSTSHRFSFELTEWQSIFQRRGIDIGVISRIEIPLAHQKSRCDEIMSWILYQKLIPEDFLILDDDSSLNGLSGDIKARLFLTRPYVGLVMADVKLSKSV